MSYFDVQDKDLDAVGVKSFQSQLYMNILAAGLQRKANIESWRSTNIWAMLMWQLNEIWPVQPRTRISVCAARALHATGHSRVTLSAR